MTNASDSTGLQRDDTISLDAAEIAGLTNGVWDRPDAVSRFRGVSVAEAEVAPGELYFTLAAEHWQAAKLAALREAGAAGIVVPREAVLSDTSLPVLRVDDPREALRIVAEANRDGTGAKRILITGTEGKTGLKVMLHHIIDRQAPCHAVLNSANLHVPIWRSLASIRRRDRFAIIEISVAQPNRGWQRSAIIRPHFCVITNISPQHTIYHGGLDALIRNKAESVMSMALDGACLINADNAYHDPLKDAIQRLRPVPVMAFGSGAGCDGRLLHAEFDLDRGGWWVQGRIFGQSVNYFLSMVNSYAPLASISALTVAAHLGLDLARACASLADFHPFETAGRIVTLPVAAGRFTLFDHSHRGSLAGFRSAFDDLYRIAGKRKVRLVLGAVRDLADHEKAAIHRELATFIDPERTEKIYTVGEEMRLLREVFPVKSLLGPHGDNHTEIARELFDDIRPGDVVFVKGHHRVWLSLLVAAMEARFGVADEAVPGGKSGIAPASEVVPVGRLVAGGDVMLARDMPGRLAVPEGAAPFAVIGALLGRADIALANLECVIANRGDFFPKGEARPYFYRAPPETVDVLVDAGFTALTMANNHAMDFGPDALSEQLDILAATGLAGAGAGADPEAAGRPAYLRVGDKIVALLAFATDQPRLAAGPGRPGVFETALDGQALARLRPAIAQARARADLVVVSPHWGDNWRDRPTEDIRRLAWALIDAGVDAILGHSAHVVQGIELYRGRPIVYDMGSLLFDRVGEGRMRHSALFELDIGSTGFTRLRIHPLELEPGSVRLASPDEAAATLKLITDLSRELSPATVLRSEGDTLVLALPERSPVGPTRAPERVHDRVGIRRLPANAVSAEPAGVIWHQLPADLAPFEPVFLGGGLEVLGVRFPARARRGYAFLLEVFFRYPEPGNRRWRASVLGLDDKGAEAFRYRHPVAEGAWVPQRWRSREIVCDRVVVRPPANLAAGRYRLCWNLVDADSGHLRRPETESERVRDGWLVLGEIVVDTESAPEIAGLTPARVLPSPPPVLPVVQDPEALPAGLRRLDPADLQHYKRLLAGSPERLAWQYYFPFLYLFSLTARTEEFLIGEDGGSLCIYRRNRTPEGWRLHLAFLPLPMDEAVLARCLACAQAYNRGGAVTIYWVDGADIDRLRDRPGTTVYRVEPDYILSPARLTDLRGPAFKKLRNNLSRFQEQHRAEARPYRSEDKAACLAVLADWTAHQRDKYDHILYQRYTLDCLEAAHLFDPVDLAGTVVEVDGRVRGFGFSGEMRPGLGNLFVAYSDLDIKGLNAFLKYRMLQDLGHCTLVNDARADTPGLKAAKESFAPVRLHEVYRVRVEAVHSSASTPAVMPGDMAIPVEPVTGSVDANLYLAAAGRLGLNTEILTRRPACCIVSGNGRQLFLRDQALGINSTVARAFTHDKHLTLELFRRHNVPVPDWRTFRVGEVEAIVADALARRPVVIKPRTGSFERGVCVNPGDEAAIRQAIEAVIELGERYLLVERLIRGHDYRVLFFRDRIVGVIKWLPPLVTGNGRRTLAELIADKNRWRSGYDLSEMVVEDAALAEAGIGLGDRVEDGRTVFLNRRASYRVGGEPSRVPVTAVHPENVAMFARAWRAVQLEMGGIDFISPDIGQAYQGNGAAINEINSHPNIFVHGLADQHVDLSEAERILARYFDLPEPPC